MRPTFINNLLTLAHPEPVMQQNLYAQVETKRDTPQGLEVVFNSKGYAGTWLATKIEEAFPNAEITDGNQGRNLFVTLNAEDAAKFTENRAAYLEAQKKGK